MGNKQFLCLIVMICLAVSQETRPKLPIYVGKGYDILRGNPLTDKVDPGFKYSIFNFVYKDNATTGDYKYLIPDDVESLQTTSCTFSSSVNSYRGTQSYQTQLMTKTTVSGGYDGLINSASFSASAGFQEMDKYTSELNYTVSQATAECQAYRLGISIFNSVDLSQNFIKGAQQCYVKENWSQFIQQFGTHYVYEVTMGGRTTQQTSYTYESISKLNSMKVDINVAARAKFAKFVGDTSFDYQSKKQAISYSETYSTTSKEFYVGGHPPKNGNAKDWAESVINSSMPIRYSLGLISDLIQKINKTQNFDPDLAAAQFINSLNNYCTTIACKQAIADKENPFPATYSDRRTLYYGAGIEGYPFQWRVSNPATMTLSNILMRSSNDLVLSIQLVFYDGGKYQRSPARGASTGQPKDWAIPTGQFINQIEVRSGTMIDSLTFITDKGTQTKLGGGGGRYSLCTLPEDYQIVGFYGVDRGDTITRLGFLLAKTVYPTSKTFVLESQSNLIGESLSYLGSQSGNFTWKTSQNTLNAQRFMISAGYLIDSIKIDFGVKGVSSPTFGGSGGAVLTWEVPQNEMVKMVQYKYKEALYSLLFITDRGSRSQVFAGTRLQGTNTYLEIFPDGYRIIGLYGKQGKSITDLGFYLAKTINIDNKPRHTLIRKHLLKH